MGSNLLADIDVEKIVKKSLKKTIHEGKKDAAFAERIIEKYGDADMSYEEIYQLLIHNDVDPEVAKSKARDVRPEGLNESYVAEPKTYSQVSELVSQKTKDAHVELYKEYADSLNKVSAKLDTADRSAANARHSEFRSLKLDEAYNLNAVWLHELYFANCFDPNSEIYMDSTAYLKLQRDFGTFDDWQKDFVACGLAAGEGWAVCGYNIFLRRYVNTIVSHHSGDMMMGLYPVVVVDLWSHASFRDYLTDKKSYLIAQMREFNWNVIEERFRKSEAIAEVLK